MVECLLKVGCIVVDVPHSDEHQDTSVDPFSAFVLCGDVQPPDITSTGGIAVYRSNEEELSREGVDGEFALLRVLVVDAIT